MEYVNARPAEWRGKVDLVSRHLDILFTMGEVQQNPDGRYQGAA